MTAGTAEIRSVARKLGLSVRPLQRRLLDEGGSYQGLVAEIREALARDYLQSNRLSAAEISFLLGFQDETSFHRAFKSWTGATPDALRLASIEGSGGRPG